MVQRNLDYLRIADAIEYLSDNFKNQPSLEEVAQHVHLSPTHFQRIFTEWAGVSPKKFLQYLSIDYLRSRIYNTNNLNEAADMVGFSAQSRVYDLFVSIEGVTPQEYKTWGKNLEITYGFHQTPFGECLVGVTSRGICCLSFVDESNRQTEFDHFTDKWQGAILKNDPQQTEAVVRQIFEGNTTPKIHLLVKGTNFQLKVWEALINIPKGSLTTYKRIANSIGKPNAARAVGTAIGQNPVAFLIPCHRVIRQEGNPGGYHWGETRKKAIIGWEMAGNMAS